MKEMEQYVCLGHLFQIRLSSTRRGMGFFSMHIVEPNLSLRGCVDQNIYRLNSGWKGLVTNLGYQYVIMRNEHSGRDSSKLI